MQLKKNTQLLRKYLEIRLSKSKENKSIDDLIDAYHKQYKLNFNFYLLIFLLPILGWWFMQFFCFSFCPFIKKSIIIGAISHSFVKDALAVGSVFMQLLFIEKITQFVLLSTSIYFYAIYERRSTKLTEFYEEQRTKLVQNPNTTDIEWMAFYEYYIIELIVCLLLVLCFSFFFRWVLDPISFFNPRKIIAEEIKKRRDAKRRGS